MVRGTKEVFVKEGMAVYSCWENVVKCDDSGETRHGARTVTVQNMANSICEYKIIQQRGVMQVK